MQGPSGEHPSGHVQRKKGAILFQDTVETLSGEIDIQVGVAGAAVIAFGTITLRSEGFRKRKEDGMIFLRCATE